MAVISISRDTNNNVSLVRMEVSDNLATVAIADYILNNQDAINILNGGVWSWFMTDMILVAASDGNAFFQFTDSTFESLIIYGEQGAGMINPGLINQLAYYSANGSTLSGLATANNGVLITSNAGVPSISSTLPAAVQANIITTGIITTGTWQATPVTVPFGGTGKTTFTAYSLICAGTTATGVFQNVSGVGTSGQILTSNGAAALPTWQANAASGTVDVGSVNAVAYYPAATAEVAPITTANNGVLITSGLGVPSISSTLPAAVQGNITAVGTITSGTWHGSVIGSTYGGTGVANPTAHGIMIGEGASPMTPIVLSTGQILIGSTGVDPVAAAINSGAGILVGNGAGSITVSLAAIADHTLLANISGGSLAPSSTTLTALIDNAIGSTQGNILYRNAATWVVLAPSTAGFALITGGAAANPSWASVGAAYTASALTKTDDTNVTLTLGGTPSTALLQATSITAGWTGLLSLARGGTNANLTAANGAIPYSTATAFALLAAGNSGQLLQSGGAGAPSWTTATFPSTASGTGTILRANGTNWVASTSTFADTYAINTIPFASAANTITALSPALSSVLLSTAASTGVPVWSGALTNGQLIIGSTGATPAVASLTPGTGITITPGAGSITIAATGAVSAINQVNTQAITATGAFTYTPTSGTKYAIFELQGGGGGSGGGSAAGGGQGSAPSGGGGGAYQKILVSGTSNLAAITGSVGAAGTAGAAAAGNAGVGGNTTLVINGGSTWTSAGGGAGQGSASTAGSTFSYGVTGGTNTTGTNGTLQLAVVGGTSGICNIAAAASTIGSMSSYGGSSHLGGSSQSTFLVSVAGINYGGGASAAANCTTANLAGQAGGQGIVIVTEFISA